MIADSRACTVPSGKKCIQIYEARSTGHVRKRLKEEHRSLILLLYLISQVVSIGAELRLKFGLHAFMLRSVNIRAHIIEIIKFIFHIFVIW